MTKMWRIPYGRIERGQGSWQQSQIEAPRQLETLPEPPRPANQHPARSWVMDFGTLDEIDDADGRDYA